MILKKLRFMNILSYGNYWTEVDFLKNDLTIIVGSNGVGKSTLLDALCFVLFGRAFRNINKPLLVNSITKKKLEVSIDFSTSTGEYRVIRGIKPARFEVYTSTNGYDYIIKDMTGVRDEQVALEEILGCNFKSFTQVVLLGADYKPFLKLEKAERRQVVENLLDLEVFSDMNILLKTEYADIQDDLKEFETKKTLLREKRELLMQALSASFDAKQARIDAHNLEKKGLEIEQFQLLETKLSIEQSGHILSDEEYQKTQDELKYAENKYEDWYKKDIECDQKLKMIDSELRFYEAHEVCPTCKQDIDQEFLKKMQENKEFDLERYKSAKTFIKGHMETTSEICQLKKVILDRHHHDLKQLVEIKANIALYDREISKAIEKITKEEEAQEIVKADVLEELNVDLAIVEKACEDKYENRSVLTVLGKLLKDDGIKAIIISNYMEFINELINKYLVEMDLFVNLHLDGEFNETIKSRYRDEFKYDSFSEGQKMRIDLAILFAWREIAKQRNSLSINLLIFDEVLSGSLDAEGIMDLIKILEGRFKENIFLITHDIFMISRINNHIKVEMIGGFSRMENISENTKA